MMNQGEALFLAIVLAVFFLACFAQAIDDFMNRRHDENDRD